MINSKHKGNAWERAVADYLTEKTKTKWFRVPCSGALFTTQQRELRGDVYTDNPDYRGISIECKSNKSLEINELFNKKSKLYDWVEQAQEQADVDGSWLLFIKINRKGQYVVFVEPSVMDKLNIPFKVDGWIETDDFYMVKLK